MKAIAYQQSLPVTDVNALENIELPMPAATGNDILVRIEAVSVNPVDTKVRRNVAPESGSYKVLGWDAAGVVEAVGDEVSLFSPGDKVWYAGALDRSGTNAEFHLVDERIVAKMPATLSFTEAAALPLTSITAWELLFDRFGFSAESKGTLLIMGAAGGVGSVMIQLAKQLTQLTVVATASRPETQEWVRTLGADHVINHHENIAEGLARIGINEVNAIASLTNTADHVDSFVSIIAPQGKLGVIDDAPTLDIMPFKSKCISVHWEFMFTRSLFRTDDMQEQHYLLERVAAMVDDGRLKTTMAESYGAINKDNLLKAHTLLESGASRGKIVLAGF